MTLGNTKYWIYKGNGKDCFETNISVNDERRYVFYNDCDYTWIEAVYKLFKKRTMDYRQKEEIFKVAFETKFGRTIEIVQNDQQQNVDNASNDRKEALKLAIDKMINFMSEFDFEPNFRFLNTFAYAQVNKEGKKYIENYFKLTDSPYTSAIIEKMKSIEFKEILDIFKVIVPSKKINNRFRLYYGSAGTGKTTMAMKEADSCMVCHSAMLPSDLMEDFKFNDGKAEFIPSALQIAMTEGKPIVLDEINLLPFESLRFMQTVLDGKSDFMYKGKKVEIKDGFKVIGTMNLTVNGNTYSLPEPLVDRCECIKEFKLTADNLLGALE